MTQLDRINSLISSLPLQDQQLARKFSHERKFEELWDLVGSSVERARRRPDKYPEVDFADMTILKSEVGYYMEQLGYEEEY